MSNLDFGVEPLNGRIDGVRHEQEDLPVRSVPAIAIVAALAVVLGSSAAQSATTAVIKGTPQSDKIQGTHGGDIIYGFAGNDEIDGRGGSDVIYGGLGNDTLSGGGGKDYLSAGRGTTLFPPRTVNVARSTSFHAAQATIWSSSWMCPTSIAALSTPT